MSNAQGLTVTLVSLVILGAHAAEANDKIVLVFDSFPTSADLVEAASGLEGKWSGLLDALEVSFIEDYKADLLGDVVDGVGYLSFDCLDDEDKKVGVVVIEEKPLYSSTAVQVV